MKGLIVVGAGGLGREVLEYATQIAGMGLGPAVSGFLDDDPHALDGYGLSVEVIGAFTDEEMLDGDVVVALGDPELRHKIRAAVQRAGGRLHTVLHPAAWVASSASVGAGCIVAPGAFVGSNVTLGQNVLVNATVSVGHDTSVGQDSVLSPHVALSGRCSVAPGVLIGTHATLTPGVNVGTGSRIASGAVVTRDVPEFAIAAGNPAKSRVVYRSGK